MTSAFEIKKLLDNELKPDIMGKTFEEINKNAISFFQKLFVEQLNFDLIEGDFGEIGENIPIKDWNKAAEAQKAYFISEKDDFRIIYVTTKKLTRNRERSAISSLKRERWAIKGEYICIFYAEESVIWHMVCPHYTEGKTIIRRYILGSGENHRTVSENLTMMDASFTEPLFDRVQEAFKIQVVTEKFYERYKEVFEEIKDHLLIQKIKVSDAKKFTHLLLNRFMFIYFIQKKGWINNDKNFMFNFSNKYLNSGEKNHFYEKWIKMLFFKAMSIPISEKSINQFDNDVNNVLNNIPFLNGGLFEEYDVDKLNFTLSDKLLLMVINNFLEEYNFTITEESPYDLDIAIDPAMLGKIYESLIAEEERGKAGIFYTPRIEVDFMCRLAILEYILEDRNKILSTKDDKFNLRKELIDYIFTPFEEWDEELNSKYEFVRKALNNVRIVDPACGSGAFLVGMMQVLNELYMKLGVKINYYLKENTIYNTLYGVDIKDWAVRMAEFRMWLALIESEEKIPEKSPILPNLSFKLQCGDSLIQKIGDTEIDLRNYKKNISQQMRDEISKILKLKMDFFKGKKELFDKIKNMQLSMITNDIKNQITNLENEIKTKSQKDLQGNITKESLNKTKEIREKLKINKEIIIKLKSKGIQAKFFWDLNFPEIMMTGGFDIVIGNPPYIRQEKIIDQAIDLELLNNMTTNELSKHRTQYKADLANFVKKDFKLITGKTCDLYVFFYFKSIELLNENGLFILITSNTWLDSNFGRVLQEGLLKLTHLKFIINNQAKRSFEQADVNTIIVLGKKKTDIDLLQGNINFLTLKEAFEYFTRTELMQEVLIPNKENFRKIDYYGEALFLLLNLRYKLIKISELSVWNIGGGKSTSIQTKLTSSKKIYATGKYELSKWSKFLRAPEIFFKIIENSKENFTSLGNRLKRGYTTGANEFFYLPLPLLGKTNKYFRSEINIKNGNLNLFLKNKKVQSKFKKFLSDENLPIFSIENEYWTRTYGEKLAGSFNLKIAINDKELFQTPNYLIKTPKELVNLTIFPKNLNFLVLHINDKKDKLLPGVRKYVEWGESMRFHRKPTCASRSNWYDLGSKIRRKIVCIIDVDKRYVFSYNKFRFDIDARLYGIEFEEKNKLNFLFLKSNLYPLLMELEGRVGLGDGALDIKVCDYENLMIPSQEIIKNIKEDKIERIMTEILAPDFKNESIFKIIGTEDSNLVELERIKQQIRDIDVILFEELLGLNEIEQLDIYKSIIDLVKNRLDKAKSV